MARMNMIQAINSAMDVMLERDSNTVIFGEDVGYFGGVFRCTAGLQKKYGTHRVFDSPIAEGGILAAAVGMGVYGLRPVVEIQFADYIYPAFDQLVSDVYLSFVSLNGNAWTFSTQAVLLSVGGMNVDGNGTDDNGYWGGSTTTAVSVNAAGQWVLSGNGEPHGTLLLPGSFSQITWTGLSENWHGFTVGVKGVTPPAPPTVPVPAAGLLLAGGLALLSRLRRAR